MRVRWALVIVSMTLATVLVRYGPPGARTFSATFPVNSVFNLPISLHDRTGLVTGFEVHEPDPSFFGDFHSGQVAPSSDRPQALFVQWFGGCEDSVEITVAGTEQELDMLVKPGRSFRLFGYACPAAAVAYAVVVDLVRRIDPADVHVIVQPV